MQVDSFRRPDVVENSQTCVTMTTNGHISERRFPEWMRTTEPALVETLHEIYRVKRDLRDHARAGSRSDLHKGSFDLGMPRWHNTNSKCDASTARDARRADYILTSNSSKEDDHRPVQNALDGLLEQRPQRRGSSIRRQPRRCVNTSMLVDFPQLEQFGFAGGERQPGTRASRNHPKLPGHNLRNGKSPSMMQVELMELYAQAKASGAVIEVKPVALCTPQKQDHDAPPKVRFALHSVRLAVQD